MQLKEISLFQGLSNEQLKGIEAITRKISIESGKTVFTLDDKGDEFYILLKGKVRVEIPMEDGRQVISFLRAGTIFGEVGLFEQKSRSATVVAEEDCEMLAVTNNDFLELLENDSTIAATFYRSLAMTLYQRVTQTTENLVFCKIALSYTPKND